LKTNTAIFTFVLSSFECLFLGNEDNKDLYYCAPRKLFLIAGSVCDRKQDCVDYGDEIGCQGMREMLRIINLLCGPRF
jgi:hypothetical protein